MRVCKKCDKMKDDGCFMDRPSWLAKGWKSRVCKECEKSRQEQIKQQRIEELKTLEGSEEFINVIRTCVTCGEGKHLVDFPKNKLCTYGRSNTCRACTNKACRKHVAKKKKDNPDFVARRYLSQEKQRAKRYGLTVEELHELHRQADGVCQICGNKPNKDGRPKDRGNSANILNIDHCHTTGKVRGLLCSRCNITLGVLEEDPELMRKMAEYIEENG